MLQAADLIRVAELTKLCAETARAFSSAAADGKSRRIDDAANQIEAAALELEKIGREMGGVPSQS